MEQTVGTRDRSIDKLKVAVYLAFPRDDNI
jgi:hypothetical protein